MAKPTVAILGASADRSKFGNKSVRAHRAAGFQVFPVNTKGGEVEGLPSFTSLAEVPVEKLNRVSVYLPPAITFSALDEIAAKGCGELWLNPGSYNEAVTAKAEQLGLHVIRGCSIVNVGHSPSDFPA